jgi:hypothetical protein
MSTQSHTDSEGSYPPPIVSEEELKREASSLRPPLHISSSEMQERAMHRYSAKEERLSPAVSIVSEEEEEEITVAVRRVRDYNHALTCFRHQLGLGMMNCGPR